MKMTNFVRKCLSVALCAAITAGITFALPTDTAFAKKNKEKKQSATAEAQQEGYLFTSANYHYTILCPQKPIGSVPAKMFFNDNSKRGDVIIFETFDNDIYKVKSAWVVLADAFDDESIPDLNKINEKDGLELLKKIQSNNGYAAMGIVDISDKNRGIYAVTAKEVEIDTNNDGNFDTVATSDTQTVVTFFRGNLGGRFCVRLIDNPDLRKAMVDAYKYGISTLREVPLKF